MRSILILGAANDQLPLILKAKELGYYVIVCDYTLTNPGLKFVDKHYHIDYMDRDAVLKVAESENIDGIVSNSEPVMQIVAYVSKKLGLRGNSVDSVKNVCEKDLFRKVQSRAGVFLPRQNVVKSDAEALSFAQTLNFPIIFKPCRNSASRGISKINSFRSEDIVSAFDACKEESWNKHVLIEEFVEMPSNVVIEGDLFIYDGIILWDGFFHTYRSPFNKLVPMTYSAPLQISSAQMDLIKNTISKIIKEAGLSFGQFNIEMYFTLSNELFVIEINPRQGGRGIPRFIENYSGIDYSKLLVSLCVNDYSYESQIKDKRLVKSRFLTRHVVYSHQNGIFEGLKIDSGIADKISKTEYLVDEGALVHKCINGTDAIAIVDVQFENLEEQNYYIHHLEEMIKPCIS